MRATLLFAMLFVAAAQAQTGGSGQSWSVVGARTTGQGGNLLEAGLGWPGIHASFVHGATPNLDLGGRVSFNYGYEGSVQTLLPGVKAQFLLHYKLLDREQVSLAFHFEPGPLFYFPGCTFDRFGNRVCPGNVVSGFSFPVGLHLGIAASSAVNIGISFDVPVWLLFGQVNTVQLPFLIGAGAEYFLKSNLLLYVMLRMGPTLYTSGALAVFTVEGKVGVGFRF